MSVHQIRSILSGRSCKGRSVGPCACSACALLSYTLAQSQFLHKVFRGVGRSWRLLDLGQDFAQIIQKAIAVNVEEGARRTCSGYQSLGELWTVHRLAVACAEQLTHLLPVFLLCVHRAGLKQNSFISLC